MPKAAEERVEFLEAGSLEDQFMSFILGDPGREPAGVPGKSELDKTMDLSGGCVAERENVGGVFAALDG
jgi:hypothetical protein